MDYVLPYIHAQDAFFLIFDAVPEPVRDFVVLSLLFWGGVGLLDILTTRT